MMHDYLKLRKFGASRTIKKYLEEETLFGKNSFELLFYLTVCITDAAGLILVLTIVRLRVGERRKLFVERLHLRLGELCSQALRAPLDTQLGQRHIPLQLFLSVKVIVALQKN
jgi:hypothetical protein